MTDADGQPIARPQALRNVVEEAVLADELGVDFIGLGEHHRADFAISAPEVVLAAIAARTRRIHLGSAVTVLSSDDPIRVFQRFSTLDAVSNGRAEVILGRGSFTESFPLFGFNSRNTKNCSRKSSIFSRRCCGNEPVTWPGKTRAAADRSAGISADRDRRLKTWIGVGGSPESVVRAARYDLPLMLAIIGGDPKRFVPYVDLYHRAYEQIGKPARPIGVHSPGYVADTDEQAREEFWPDYKRMRDRIGGERGWPPMQRERIRAGGGTARSMSARRRRSPPRSPPPRRRSASLAST